MADRQHHDRNEHSPKSGGVMRPLRALKAWLFGAPPLKDESRKASNAVDLSSDQSFPASDPPSYTPGKANPE